MTPDAVDNGVNRLLGIGFHFSAAYAPNFCPNLP